MRRLPLNKQGKTRVENPCGHCALHSIEVARHGSYIATQSHIDRPQSSSALEHSLYMYFYNIHACMLNG